MNCRNIIKSYLSILVVLSFTSQPKAFAQSSIGCEAKLYELSNVAETQKLTAADMIDDSDFVEQIGNNREQSLPTNSPYKSNAIKNVARYWQMRVNDSDLPINANDVKYTLQPNSEENNPFKQSKFEAKPFSTIETIEKCTDQTTVISGGVTLEFRELSSLVPGKYRGRIDVCIPVNGNQCG